MSDRPDPPSIQPAAFTPDAVITPAPYQPSRAAPIRPWSRIPVGRILILALLAACATVAWFVLTARSLYVQTDPAAAAVTLRGGIRFRVADYYLIRPGDYTIAIAADGYYPLDEKLTVGADRYQRVTFTLKKLPGRLSVRTTPAAGATITIDGAARGTTPAQLRDLAPGQHQLRIELERYLPHDQAIAIEGRGIEQQMTVALTPAWAPVGVSTEPAGAEVRVDEESVGQTPLNTEIMQGTHTLRIQLSGYKAWQEKIAVTANQPLELPLVRLQVADAIVRLESTPPGAGATVNGEFRGQTPLDLDLTPGTQADIRLFREGFKPASRKLTLASGEKQSLRIDLEPELTVVEIVAEPADAELYIDGAARGPVGQKVGLTTQPHTIRIQKAGYVPFEATFTPRNGIAQEIRATLKSEQQAKLESIKPEIRTAAGQTLKLFRPDETFNLGTSRREPGRRANEALHPVRLSRPFYFAVRETTNAEFRQYAAGHSSGALQNHSLDDPQQPVVKVSWEDAALFCNWLSTLDSLTPFYQVRDGRVAGFDPKSTGYRLPTEAEWAWAARSTANGQPLRFPWGDALPPPPKSGNYADESAADLVGSIIKSYQDGFAVSAPVASFAANGKGLYDLGGNVAEWVNDFHDIAVGQDVATDPLGPAAGEQHVISGASWAQGGLTELRLSFRDYGLEGRDDVGFRIARYLE